MLWIYIAVHGFAKSENTNERRQWPRSRDACVAIAQGPTPLMVVGGEMDVDQVEAGKINVQLD